MTEFKKSPKKSVSVLKHPNDTDQNIANETADTKIFGLSSDDILDLSAILSYELRTYQKNPPAFPNEYIAWLNTIAGLGYAAVLSEKCVNAKCLYREYLDSFLTVQKDSLQLLTTADIETISQTIANMVGEAMTAFSVIQFPKFYESFADALQQAICHVRLHGDSILSDKAARLMRIVNCHKHDRA